MNGKAPYERILFGLKLRQLRQERELSAAELSARSGLSVSYLNEIEKGKKFPKEQKLHALANALGILPETLASGELPKSLSPVENLLRSNFLNELPLDLFGIELAKVVEIIANTPLKVGAFISTLVELARNYAMAEEHFYFGALRSYLEMNNNYFEELETEVANFTRERSQPEGSQVPVNRLQEWLEELYGYRIEHDGLGRYPELEDIRSVFVPKTRTLLLNEKLTTRQKAFQFGKELGFNYLGLKERALTASLLKVKSFEEALNHFKAGYFSAALLINREKFKADLEQFFAGTSWDGNAILELLRKYDSSPEMLLQRMTNLLPRFFGLDQLFFLRCIHTPASGHLHIDKELHLSRKHHPHTNLLNEHYCRRWLSFSLLEELRQLQGSGTFAGTLVGAQRSRFVGTTDEYLNITLARPAYPSPDQNISVTIGILLNGQAKKNISFCDDPSLSDRLVHNTCERCPIADCRERAAPPLIIEEKERNRKIQQTLLQLTEEGKPSKE